MTLAEALRILNRDLPVWEVLGNWVENTETHRLISHERAVELAEKVRAEREQDEGDE